MYVLFFSVIALGAIDNKEQLLLQSLDGAVKKGNNRSDKKAAKVVADYVVSQEFIFDVNAFLGRSTEPVRQYLHNYFFHCDFHKDQLQKMKQCFAEFDALMQDSIPVCVHAIFSYVVSDAMTQHVQATAQNALDTRAMAIYATPIIMEHIEEQNNVLSQQEKEQFIVLKDRWNKWYERWQDFLYNLSSYVEARSELREDFINQHKKSLLFGLIWRHVGPAAWFFISKFSIARIIFGNSVNDPKYFLIQLMLRLHKNVTSGRTVLEEKIIASTKDSFSVYSRVVNQVIDERLAFF